MRDRDDVFEIYTAKVYLKDKVPSWAYRESHETDLRLSHPR